MGFSVCLNLLLDSMAHGKEFEDCVGQKKPHEELKCRNHCQLWSPQKNSYGSSNESYIVVSVVVYIFLQSIIQDRKKHILCWKGKKKKNPNYLYHNSKTRHSCATSAFCVLGTCGLQSPQ